MADYETELEALNAIYDKLDEILEVLKNAMK